MPETISISIASPLNSVELLNSYTKNSLNEKKQIHDVEIKINEQLREQQEKVSQFCKTLENITNKLTSLHEKSICENRQQIAKLSVEIARKILLQQVDDNNYNIETIIQEVLNSSPGGKEIKIYLNPTDYKQCQKIQKDEKLFKDITFLSDPEIGKAECIFESTKGNIESFIDSKLKQIAEELKKAV